MVSHREIGDHSDQLSIPNCAFLLDTSPWLDPEKRIRQKLPRKKAQKDEKMQE